MFGLSLYTQPATSSCQFYPLSPWFCSPRLSCHCPAGVAVSPPGDHWLLHSVLSLSVRSVPGTGRRGPCSSGWSSRGGWRPVPELFPLSILLPVILPQFLCLANLSSPRQPCHLLEMSAGPASPVSVSGCAGPGAPPSSLLTDFHLEAAPGSGDPSPPSCPLPGVSAWPLFTC